MKEDRSLQIKSRSLQIKSSSRGKSQVPNRKLSLFFYAKHSNYTGHDGSLKWLKTNFAWKRHIFICLNQCSAKRKTPLLSFDDYSWIYVFEIYTHLSTAYLLLWRSDLYCLRIWKWDNLLTTMVFTHAMKLHLVAYKCVRAAQVLWNLPYGVYGIYILFTPLIKKRNGLQFTFAWALTWVTSYFSLIADLLLRTKTKTASPSSRITKTARPIRIHRILLSLLIAMLFVVVGFGSTMPNPEKQVKSCSTTSNYDCYNKNNIKLNASWHLYGAKCK